MSRVDSVLLLGLAICLCACAARGAAGSAHAGCAQPIRGCDEVVPYGLAARGPGALFASAEEAALDALIYAYLQGRCEDDFGHMRAGSVYATGEGYSYGPIHVARGLVGHRVVHALGPRDVARFAVYPRGLGHAVDRANERPSRADRRSVRVIDPLHRPLYILHPSLAVRAVRGAGGPSVPIGDLRQLARGASLLAGP